MDASERSCAQLWSAVISQLLADATSTATYLDKERREARAWFARINADFREVCALAGLDHPENVQARALKLFAEADSGIPAAGTPDARKPLGRKRLVMGGQTLTLREWATRTGLHVGVIRWRLNAGWSVEAALATPAAPRKDARPRWTGGGSKLLENPRDRRGSVTQDSV